MSDPRPPMIVRLTPTSYDDLCACPRRYLLSTILRVPASDAGRGSPDQGLLVHAVLETVHREGSCQDPRHVEAILERAAAATPQMRAFVTRHAARCPDSAERSAHEVDRARFHRTPAPMFLATARIDAVWVHDGLLDARDYKTGAVRTERLADDPRARIQAWVLGRDARRTGLRLRLRYEHLQPEIPEDPEVFEPDEDDLDAITEELRAAVARLWGDDPWRGVTDPEVCGWCRFRSVCRDSATPGEPAWAALAAPDGGTPSTPDD